MSCEPVSWVIERKGDYAIARPSRRIEDCAECSGKGLTRATIDDGGRTYEVMSPCALKRTMGRIDAWNQASIPAVHSASTFESFKPALQEVARGFTIAKDFGRAWPTVGKGFVLSGPVGTGKTHLLVAALRQAIERGASAAYVEISLLYATIRRGFQEGKSGGEIIGPLSKVELLAIDELGKGRGSPFELETLDELIARRYNAGKVTLFATNYSLRPPEERARSMISTGDLKDAAKDSRQLCDRVGERIYSRLCEMCDFVEFPAAAPDFRRSKISAPLRPG